MKFDWTINLGTITPIVLLLLTIIYRLSKMESKVDIMWTAFVERITRYRKEDDEYRKSQDIR